MTAMLAKPGMASKLVLFLVALAIVAQPGEAATIHSLRGHHHGHKAHHHPHHSGLAHVQVPSDEESKSNRVVKSKDPLKDDFLHIMEHAASKALKEQKAVPAYNDFLNVMHIGAKEAYDQQAGAPDYDQFLVLMKDKSAQAYHDQVELPSYDDFLLALKESSVSVLSEPSPNYAAFLNKLENGAEKAMQKRVFHELNETTINALAAHYQANPFSRKGVEDKMKEIEDHNRGKHDGSNDKLQEELEQEKHQHHGGAAAKKPVMTRINLLRTQLCWKRPNLWQHEKCLRFLGLTCMEQSTGEGICKRFTQQANKRCKTETDPEWRKDYCALGEALSDTYGEDDGTLDEEGASDEEVAGEDGQSNGADEDADAHEEGAEAIEGEDGTGSEEDLDEELAGMDETLAEGENSGKDGEQGKKDGAEGSTDGSAGANADGSSGADADGSSGADGNGGAGADGSGKAGADGNGEAGADQGSKDSDGDGVPDSEDAFANDPSESKDTDNDGIGDNSDSDIDGDGHDNAVDAFPLDAKESKDTDRDGIGDNADKDIDNDGIDNDKDKFPTDPTEWKDSDGDGVGDNRDAYPFNPNCHKDPCDDVSKHGAPKPQSAEDPSSLDMDNQRSLPAQGFNEAMTGAPVHHDNYYTYTADWQDEWPSMPETEHQTMSRICEEHPKNVWCRRFAGRDSHFR